MAVRPSPDLLTSVSRAVKVRRLPRIESQPRLGFAGHRIFALIPILCGLATAGCASKAPVHELRHTPTGIAAGDVVAFILNKYERPPPDAGPDESERLATERELISCVNEALEEGELRLEVMPPEKLREAAFPDRKTEEIPQDPAAILTALAAGGIDGAPEISGLRYVMLFDLTVSESASRAERLPSEAVGVVRTRQRHVHLEATVLDLINGRIAGQLITSSRGARGGGVVFLYIVPVPIVVLADPDGTACHELGQALVRFLAQ